MCGWAPAEKAGKRQNPFVSQSSHKRPGQIISTDHFGMLHSGGLILKPALEFFLISRIIGVVPKKRYLPKVAIATCCPHFPRGDVLTLNRAFVQKTKRLIWKIEWQNFISTTHP